MGGAGGGLEGQEWEGKGAEGVGWDRMGWGKAVDGVWVRVEGREGCRGCEGV